MIGTNTFSISLSGPLDYSRQRNCICVEKTMQFTNGFFYFYVCVDHIGQLGKWCMYKRVKCAHFLLQLFAFVIAFFAAFNTNCTGTDCLTQRVCSKAESDLKEIFPRILWLWLWKEIFPITLIHGYCTQEYKRHCQSTMISVATKKSIWL